MFFDSLKVACAQNGTSPTSLLKKLGMSTSSVTSWKNGVVPSLKTVYQLAEALGIDPAQLLEGSGVAQGEDTKKAPALTEKDKRDVAKDVAGSCSCGRTGSGSSGSCGAGRAAAGSQNTGSSHDTGSSQKVTTRDHIFHKSISS